MAERRWQYCEPGVDSIDPPTVVEMTDSEILLNYFDYWSAQMWKVNKADQISEQACIDDWVVMHWASEVP